MFSRSNPCIKNFAKKIDGVSHKTKRLKIDHHARKPTNNVAIYILFYKKGVVHSTSDPRGCVVTVLQCLATCNLVDSPVGNDLSWLLYYLARPQIAVGMDHIKNRLNHLMTKINYPAEPLDPVEILKSICSFDIMSR